MDAIEFSSENGSKAITKLLEHYSDPADVVESASIQAKRTEAYITVVLPTLQEAHPLFTICRVEVNYKKAALLQSPQSMVMDIDASQKSVRVPLIQLSPATTYRCKIRLANKNGWGEWAESSQNKFAKLPEASESRRNCSVWERIRCSFRVAGLPWTGGSVRVLGAEGGGFAGEVRGDE